MTASAHQQLIKDNIRVAELTQDFARAEALRDNFTVLLSIDLEPETYIPVPVENWQEESFDPWGVESFAQD